MGAIYFFLNPFWDTVCREQCKQNANNLTSIKNKGYGINFILNQVFLSNTGTEPWTEILHEHLPDSRNEGNIPAATFRIDPIGRSIHELS